jgi:hypothetical protein
LFVPALHHCARQCPRTTDSLRITLPRPGSLSLPNMEKHSLTVRENWSCLEMPSERASPSSSRSKHRKLFGRTKRHSSLRVTFMPVSTCPAPPWHGERILEGRRPDMELAFFLKDEKTPLLRPRLTHLAGQFTDTQAGDGISTGGDESHIHVDVMAPGLMGGFIDGRPRVLIPPRCAAPGRGIPAQDTAVDHHYTSLWRRHVSLLVPALPPLGRQEREEAQKHAPLQRRTQAQYSRRSPTRQ